MTTTALIIALVFAIISLVFAIIYGYLRAFLASRNHLSQIEITREAGRILQERLQRLPFDETPSPEQIVFFADLRSFTAHITDSPSFAGTSEQLALLDRLCPSVGASKDHILGFIAALDRVLADRHRFLSSSLRRRRSVNAAERGPIRAAQDYTPDQSALLAQITEKFYASWTFRFVSGMLVAAALFAIGGSIVIGDQTLNLRQELRDAGTVAKKDIDDLRKATRDALSDQANDLSRQNAIAKADIGRLVADTSQKVHDEDTKITVGIAALDDKRARLSDSLETETKNLEAKMTEFNNYTNQLRAAAITKIVQEVQEGLKKQESSINAQILTPLEEIQNKDLAALRGRVERITQTIDQLDRDSVSASGKVNAATAGLASVQAVIDRSRSADTDITAVKGDIIKQSTEATRLLAETRSSRSEVIDTATAVAKQAATATDSRDKIVAIQKKLDDTSSAQLIAIGVIQDRITTLTASADKIAEDQRHSTEVMAQAAHTLLGVKQTSEDLAAAQSSLKALQPRISELQASVANGADILTKAKPALGDISNAEETLRAVRFRLATFQPSTDDIASRVQAMSHELDGAAQELSGLTKAKQILHDANTGVADLIGSVNKANQSLAAIQKQMDGLQPAVDELKARLAKTVLPVPPDAQIVPAQEPPLQKLTKQEVIVIQRALISHGFKPGDPDGLTGPQTEAAIRAFQASIQEPETGKLTAAQRERLLRNKPI